MIYRLFLQDIIFTQEEFGKQAAEFQKFRKMTEGEILKLKVAILNRTL